MRPRMTRMARIGIVATSGPLVQEDKTMEPQMNADRTQRGAGTRLRPTQSAIGDRQSPENRQLAIGNRQ